MVRNPGARSAQVDIEIRTTHKELGLVTVLWFEARPELPGSSALQRVLGRAHAL